VNRRRVLRRTISACALAAGCAALIAPQSSADAADTSGQASGRRGISVIQVEGLIDPPTASLIRGAVRDANRRDRTLLLFQVDSKGSVDVDARPLVRAIAASKVPVVVWVGPPGAHARGVAALLLEAATKAYVSPGSSAGAVHPLLLDQPDATSRAEVARELERRAVAAGRNGAAASGLATHERSARQLNAGGAVDAVRPTVGEVIVQLNGKTVKTRAGERKLSTAKVIGHGRGVGASPIRTLSSTASAWARRSRPR